MPVRLGSAQEKIPVSGLILYHLFQIRCCSGYLLLQSIETENLLHNIAVQLVGIVTALDATGHFNCLVTTLHKKQAVRLADFNTMLDDDALEYRIIL